MLPARHQSINGINWVEHPNALLVAVPPDDCGCGLSLAEWVKMGTSSGLHVLIVASGSNEEISILQRARLAGAGVTLQPKVDLSTIRQLSPRDQTTVFLIRQGRVVRKLEGGVPPASFLS